MASKIKLLTSETNRLINVSSISTITIYNCINNNLNIEMESNYEEYIIKKINNILKINPWLNGTLKKINDTIYLEYDNFDNYTILNNLNDFNNIYTSINETVCKNDNITSLIELFMKDSNTYNYTNLMNHLDKYLVKPGNKCVNTTEKLFKVILIKIPDNKFALVISLSHCIADGHTYYKIFNMFSKNVKEEILNCDRMFEFEDVIKKNKYEIQNCILKKIFSFPNLFSQLFFNTKKNNTELKIISKEIINDIKTKYNNSIIVSTNDIITSEFFNNTNATVGIMSLNYRTINDEYKFLAGNYIDFIFYKIKNKSDPFYIRNKLNQYKKNTHTYYHNKNFILKTYEFITNLFCIFNLVCITSWQTLYKELIIENSEFVMHLPCIKDFNTTSYFTNFCVVFHYSNDKIGILSDVKNMFMN